MNSGKTLSNTASKEEKTREIRKKLREQEMLRQRRIVQEQRREESRRALVEEQQQKMKQQWQTKNKMKQEVNHSRKRSVDQIQSDWKHGIMVKIMREDESRIRKLGEARDILRKEKDDAYYDKVVGHLRQMEEKMLKDKKQLPAGPDKVYTELWYRQEKLFRALGERSLQEIKNMLAFTPTILQVKAKKVYQDYPPHRHMQKLLNDLVAGKITEQFFYKESSELVKKMSPSRIIEHHRREEASTSGPLSLMKVSSQPLIDRFTIAWSAAKLDGERALTVAERVVANTLRQAQSVYSQLMQGSSADLTLLTIGSLDQLQEKVSQQLRERSSSSGTSISLTGLEHVHFSERDIVRPRPLDSGQQFSELKKVLDRPPTPIPSEEHLRIITENQQLVDEITLQSEKFLQQKMSKERITSPKDLARRMPPPSSPTSTREKLKRTMMEKLEDLRRQMKKGDKHKTQVSESVLELIPRMDPTHRENFVSDMAKLVSEVIGATMKQAETIMTDAIKATSEGLGKHDADESEADTTMKPPDQTKEGDTDTDKKSSAQAFHPVFGASDLGVNSSVVVGSLAAYSVKHSSGETGHEGHDHRPPVSHMRTFFKQRASLAAPPTTKLIRVDRKRHSMPATLPICMDPTQMHGRNSFMSLVQPDLKTVAEFRDKTRSQVEAVLRDHSAFGNVTLEEAPDSDEEEEEVGSTDPSAGRPQLPPALVMPADAPGEAADTVGELLAGPVLPRVTPSMPTYRRPSLATGIMQPARSLTASRMLIQCDSDPRLSLRTSTAEIQVDIQQHSHQCPDHDAEAESEDELRKLESSALGFDNVERTSSDTHVERQRSEMVTEVVPARRAGSVDGEPLLVVGGADSDDELELRVLGEKKEGGEVTAAPPEPEQQ